MVSWGDNLMDEKFQPIGAKWVKKVCSPRNFELTKLVDEISNLPEGILSHIVSFLPMTDVVRTSILSKGLRNIMTLTTNLYYDYTLFPMVKRKMETFINFVDRSLFLDSRLVLLKFRLSFGSRCSYTPHANVWIEYVIKCKVKEVDLNIPKGEARELPCSLFTCESLTVLKLNLNYSFLKLPATMAFSSLRILQLTEIGFLDHDLIQELLCSSNVLENLNMERCVMMKFKIFNISSHSLKSLSIIDCHGLSECKVKISTPSLVTFHFIGSIARHYVLDLPSLVDAVITFRGLTEEDYERFCVPEYIFQNLLNFIKGYACCLSQILKGLYRAKVLTFCISGIEDLCPELDLFKWVPTFSNMKHLKLSVGLNKDHIKLMACLLESSPNLDTLVLDFLEPFSPVRRALQSLPTLDNLKHLKLYTGLDKVLVRTITCLLKSFPNLETLVVNIIEQYNIDEDRKIFTKSQKLVSEIPLHHLKKAEIKFFGITKNFERVFAPEISPPEENEY